VWQWHPAVVPGPRVPVAVTKPRGVDLDDHAIRRRRRIGDRPDVDRSAELLEDDSAHELIVPCCRNVALPCESAISEFLLRI
jgi:hypothetical protein